MKHRLIDADEAKAKTKGTFLETINYVTVGKDINRVFEKIIDVTPTIKAIPIEWIENRIKQLSDIADGFDKDSLSHFLSEVKVDALKDMLKDWEKENERER